jgi:DNA gyrase subunit B
VTGTYVENKQPGTYEGRSGTEITFMPSTDTFTMVEFDYGTLEHRLRELAFLNSGVRIVLTDMRHADVKTPSNCIMTAGWKNSSNISTAPRSR